MFKNKVSMPVVASSGGGKAKTVTVKQSDLEKGNYQTDNTDILNELKKDLGNTVLQIVNDSGEIVGEFKFKGKYYDNGHNKYSKFNANFRR